MPHLALPPPARPNASSRTCVRPRRGAASGLWLLALTLTPTAGAAQELRAEEALALAAASNPSLEAAARDAAAARYGREAERDAVRPTVTASVGASRNERFSATSQGPSLNEDHGGDARVGVAHTAALGTRVSAEITSSMSWQTVNLTAGTTTAVTIGPVYRGQVALTATQPLLRGAGRDATRASLGRSRALERQADHRYDQAASELARDVLVAYWELWYAQRALEVRTQSLALATQQLEEATQRQETLGTLARADVLRFATERLNVQNALVTSTQQRDARALELARLLALAPSDALGLVAVTRPALDPYQNDLATALALTLAHSSEWLAVEAELEAAEEALRATADSDQARLDLTVQASMAGIWADDMLSGLALPNGRPAFSIGARVELELPVGGGRAEGAHQQARAQLFAAQARARAREQAIETELATLMTELQSAHARAEQSMAQSALAEELAAAERERLALGTTTPIALIEAQQQARDALLQQERAALDEVLVVLRLRHRTGELMGSLVAPAGASAS
ncbi:MAG: TolC family protein [Myxococcales bacterium]|nr:TolC family protein [Myxococcales bacterium]MCB9628244.1 TolC family protein [Sandaracinaceae bacterium]